MRRARSLSQLHSVLFLRFTVLICRNVPSVATKITARLVFLQKAALKQLRRNKKVRGITLLEPDMNPQCIIQSGFKLES